MRTVIILAAMIIATSINLEQCLKDYLLDGAILLMAIVMDIYVEFRKYKT